MWDFRDIEIEYGQDRNIKIVDLCDAPQAIPTVARWIHEEWSKFSGRTAEQTLARYRDGIERGQLPVSLIAVRKEKPLGLASLREKDSVDWYPGVMPWICNVYVKKSSRGTGIASLLCKALEKVAIEMEFPIVYLATEFQDSLYHRLGYKTFHILEKLGHTYYVTKHILPK
jgi:GNAT superfamily N-acetyltransferase